MTSFKERFKDKVVHVGRDGEHAMLSAQPHPGVLLPRQQPSAPRALSPLAVQHPARVVAPLAHVVAAAPPSGAPAAVARQRSAPISAAGVAPTVGFAAAPPAAVAVVGGVRASSGATRLPPIAPKSAPAIRALSTGAPPRSTPTSLGSLGDGGLAHPTNGQHHHHAFTPSQPLSARLPGMEAPPRVAPRTTAPVVVSLFGSGGATSPLPDDSPPRAHAAPSPPVRQPSLPSASVAPQQHIVVAGARGVPPPPPFAAVSPSSIWRVAETPASGCSTPSAAPAGARRQRGVVETGVAAVRHQAAAGVAGSGPRPREQAAPAPPPPPLPDRAAVEYRPYSIDDYRRLRERDVAAVNKPRGGLGPNDSDDVRKMRELRSRGKEYGACNNKVNLTVLPFQKTKEPPTPSVATEVVEARERREKAKEFARHVPRPKVRDVSALLNGSGSSGPPSPSSFLSPSRSTAQMLSRDRLAELEAQHERDVAMVEALKKQLKL